MLLATLPPAYAQSPPSLGDAFEQGKALGRTGNTAGRGTISGSTFSVIHEPPGRSGARMASQARQRAIRASRLMLAISDRVFGFIGRRV